MSPEEIEKVLSTTAQELGVSDAKLKAIYARGVKDCIKEGYPEAPYVHGLNRVQQFARAMTSDSNTPDEDLLPKSGKRWVAPHLDNTEAVIFYKDSNSWTAFGDTWACDMTLANGSWTIYTVE